MYKITLSLFIVFSLSLFANPKSNMHCSLSQEGPVSIQWEAYKTPQKVGVSGSFDQVKYSAAQKEGINFRQILVGAKIDINTTSVNSKNSGRDAKLVAFFFKQMQKDHIHAKIIDIKPGKRERGKPKVGLLITKITFNGITKEVPMHYHFDQGILKAKGVIDLFDFGASKALASLNKACFEKHQGKTWNDVSISFHTRIKALCEPLKKQ